MKKYIAPELEVELYSLNDSIAAGCKENYDVQSLLTNKKLTAEQLNAIFGASQGYAVKADSVSNGYNLNVLAADVNETGGCDCYLSSTGNFTS